MTEHLRDGDGFILLIDEQPAGSVRWLPLNHNPGIWEMLRIGILPAWRGHNLSLHLLDAVIHRALASDTTELRLGLRADQPRLIDLYAAYGFDVAPELEYAHATRCPRPSCTAAAATECIDVYQNYANRCRSAIYDANLFIFLEISS